MKPLTHRSARFALSLVALFVVCAAAAGPAAAAPTLAVTDAGPAVPSLANAADLATILLGPGVALTGSSSVNGSTTEADYAAALPSFGRFTGGATDVAIDDGLLLAANHAASAYATDNYGQQTAADRDDDELGALLLAEGLCGQGQTAADCVNNATSIEFQVTPTNRYVKFEYALAITEHGTFDPGPPPLWSGEVFTFPDGFALFVNGGAPANNCATVPRTSTYITMESSGIVPPADTGTNRALAQANLDARIADTATPPTTPNGFSYAAQDSAWTIQFLTVPLTCVTDLGPNWNSSGPVRVKIVIADAKDSSVPPAVFLKGRSIRFSGNDVPSPVPDPIPVAVSKVGSGQGTVTSSPAGISCGATCTATFAPGTPVTLTATAASGSTFGGWAGACTGSSATCTVTASEARSATATFTASAPVTVTRKLTAKVTGSGSLTSDPAGISCGKDCTGSYADGTVVKLTAKAAAGWRLTGWTGCTPKIRRAPSCTITMSAAKTVHATFGRIPAVGDVSLSSKVIRVGTDRVSLGFSSSMAGTAHVVVTRCLTLACSAAVTTPRLTTQQVRAGHSAIRLSTRTLPAGRYRVTVRVTAGGLTSNPARSTLTVLPRPHFTG